LFRDGQFYSARGGGKTTDLPQVTDKLYHGNTSYLKTSTLNTKYIWAVLIKLHDSATYADRRKAYEWLKHQALKCN
jgi:hypothetical protein